MKTGTIFLFLLSIFVIIFIIWRNKSNKISNTLIEFVKIKSNTESTQHLPLLPKNWLSKVEEKWTKKEWGIYDNEHYDISNEICNNVYSKSKYWDKNQTHAEFLNELTKEQRIYFSLINFEGQVNNGGVYQFLFNNPESSIIALQAMQEVGIKKLTKDYKLVLNEYFGKFNSIEELYQKFYGNKKNWNKRWDSFSKGYKKLQSAETIEEYFYKEDFVKLYQRKLTEYVKVNTNKLYKTK